MDKDLLENHKVYLKRKKLNRSFGYDIDKERKFILRQATPILGRILEAGTGKGHFALALAKQGYQFVTFDISAEEQKIAKLNLAYFSLEKQVDFRIANGERTGFVTASFDVIFSVNVLHHLTNPYKVIDEFIRLLSLKGKLVLADFTPSGFKVIDKIHGLEGNTHEVGQVSLPEVESYLKKKGFVVKRAKSVYQCVFVAERGNI